MPKKKQQIRNRRSDHSLRLTFVVVGSFLFFIVAAIYVHIKAAPPPCANSLSCTSNLSGKKNATNEGIFMGRAVTALSLPDAPTPQPESQNVLGETTADYKRIYVDLANQKLYAYEGSNKVYDFPISSGKWGATPTGNFRIHVWLRYTLMAGGSKNLGTYYYLPNVPYTMYFGNASIPWSRGYALHGAYWHNNFGHPMSHGCINMKTEDVAKIYYWTNPNAGNVAYETKNNPGTLITIYGTAPAQ